MVPASTARFPRDHFSVTREAATGDDYERGRAMILTARRGDALGRAMRASIEQRIAGGAAAAGRVHLERGDTMWSVANRVLDVAQDGAKGSGS